MLDSQLVEILNDCIDRMARGASVEDCLLIYPEHARALRGLLESGLVVKRALPADGEVAWARARAESRLEQALSETSRRRAAPHIWLYTAARLAALFLIVIAGAAFAAESALPGDPLYPLKRFSEEVRVGLGDGETARQQYAARRLDETRALFDQGRSAYVSFEGVVEAIAAQGWQVASIPVVVMQAAAIDASIDVGDRVEVSGLTTPEQTLLASRIRLIHDHVQPLQQAPTATATPTAAPTPTPTSTPTVTLTFAPAVTPAPTSAVCVPDAPSDWVRYTVRSGDTLLGMAAVSGTNVDELMRVNCIGDPRTLIIGQTLLLPRMPADGTHSGGQGPGPGPGAGSGSRQSDAPDDDDHDDRSGRGNSGSGSDNSGSGGGSDDD
jgi:LysM repeat protein